MPLPPRSKADSIAMLANAPWVVAAIVVALLLGALLNPAKTPQPALGWYQHSGLQSLEWNNYLSWLRFNGQGKLAGQLEQQLAAGDVHAFSAAMLSPAFVTDSEQRARDFWSPAQRDTWSALRQQVPGQLAASNLYRWGLADSSPRPARFFTAPFTGGPLWLTALTLLALMPLASSLERTLGHGRVLTLWVLGCLLAGAGYLMLARAGARLTLADLDPRRAHRLADRLNTRWVPADSLYDVACDIFMPCALGGVLNADTIPRLHAALIVGAANNQLASDDDAQRLRQRDILYTPDYLNNAGGLISLALGHRQEDRSTIRQKVLGIGRTLSQLLDQADQHHLSPAQMADRQAEQRLHDDTGKHAWEAA